MAGPSPALRPGLALAAMILVAGCVATTPAIKSDITKLIVELSEEGGARITWDEHPRGTSASYVVYRDGREIGRVVAPDRSFLDRAIVPGRTYAYAVVGLNGQDERVSPVADPVSFTYRLYLGFTQEERVNRGYVNLSVQSRTPTLKWTDLTVKLDGEALPKSASGFSVEGAWTHANPRDSLIDLGERMEIQSKALVRRNATVEVATKSGQFLWKTVLEGRPALNLTLRQERNATDGRVALTVTGVSFVDNGRPVTVNDPSIAPRWSALDILVNGQPIRRDRLLRDASWAHVNPDDAVIRVGEHFTIRHDNVIARGTRITIMDAEAGEPAAYWVAR